MSVFTYDDSENFCNNFSLLFSTKKNSDVTFIVGEEKIQAHRFVLGLQSDFFETLLFNNQFKEGTMAEIPIDAPLEAFKLVMSYLYKAKLSLESYYTKGPVYIELLDLSKRFRIESLEKVMIRYLQTSVYSSTAFELLQLSVLYDSNALREQCIRCINTSSSTFLSYGKVGELDFGTLKDVLSNLEMKPELKKFRTLKSWWAHNGSRHTDAERKELTDLIDVTKFSNRQIFQVVGPSKLFERSYLFDIASKRYSDSEVYEEAEHLYEHTYDGVLGVRSSKGRIESEEALILAVPNHHVAYCVSFKVLVRPLRDPVKDVSFSRNIKTWSNLCDPVVHSGRFYHYQDDDKGFKYVKISGKTAVRAVKFGLVKGMSHASC